MHRAAHGIQRGRRRRALVAVGPLAVSHLNPPPWPTAAIPGGTFRPARPATDPGYGDGQIGEPAILVDARRGESATVVQRTHVVAARVEDDRELGRCRRTSSANSRPFILGIRTSRMATSGFGPPPSPGPRGRLRPAGRNSLLPRTPAGRVRESPDRRRQTVVSS